MATLTLKKKPAASRDPGAAPSPSRPPVRGHGSRARPTLAQAQEARRQSAPAPAAPAAPAGHPPGPARARPSPTAPNRPQGAARPPAPASRRPAPPPPAAPRRPALPAAVPVGVVARPAPADAPRPTLPGPAPEGERLSKRMTALGLASRREADTWIEAGWVQVNGRLAVLGQRVGPDDRIEIDPAAHAQQARRVTILIHKPVGYVSGQAEDGHEPASVLIRPERQWKEDRSGQRWHPGHLRGLAPAGRLDIDSVGLLVLTQDGRIARQLIGEDSQIEKEYLVRVEYTREGRLPDADLALLNHGLALDGKPLRPCKVSWQNEDQLRFVLREGRKRQIRRMCEAVGLKVVGLKRVRIGSVVLGHLPAGQWRYLRPDEFFA